MNQRGNGLIIGVIIVALVIFGLFGAYYIGIQSNKHLLETTNTLVSNSNNSSSATIPIASNNILFKGNGITLTQENINDSKHSYDIYITYQMPPNSESLTPTMKKELFMKDVSLENQPQHVIFSNNNKVSFRFIGPGDGYTDYYASTQHPFNVTQLKLPFDYSKHINSEIIGWIDDSHVLYYETERSSKVITYWDMQIDDQSKQKQVFF